MAKKKKKVDVHKEISDIMSAMAPICAEFYFFRGKLEAEAKEDLFIRAIDSIAPMIATWGEIAVECSKEYRRIMDAGCDFLAADGVAEGVDNEAEECQ